MAFFKRKSDSTEEKKSPSKYRALIEWAVLLTMVGVIWLGGWQAEVMGRIQSIFLYTGAFSPDTELRSDLGATSFQLQVDDLEGNHLAMEQMKGKVIFINFWATWCPPCVAEMPDINALYESMGDISPDQVVFMMVSVDKEKERIDRFLARREFSFPVYHARFVPGEFEVNSIPTTYVIDKQGNIVFKQQGLASYDNEDFGSFLRKLAEG